jgi:hypothetical protein
VVVPGQSVHGDLGRRDPQNLFKKQTATDGVPPRVLQSVPDGRLGPDAELGYASPPGQRVSRLPDDKAKAKDGWDQKDKRMGQYRYSPGQAGWIFAAGGPTQTVYGDDGLGAPL